MEKKLGELNQDRDEMKNNRFLMREFRGISIVFLLKRDLEHSAPFGSNIKLVSIDSKRDDTIWHRWQDLFPLAPFI